MRAIHRFGKRGGLASYLVDIYSVFFYMFVLVLFIMLFSLNRGCLLSLFCDQGNRYAISSELDRGLEARLLLQDMLRSPVAMPDGSTLTISELLVLHEAGAGDYAQAIEQAVRASIEPYLGQGLDEDESADIVPRSWGMRVMYRGAPALEMGALGNSPYPPNPWNYGAPVSGGPVHVPVYVEAPPGAGTCSTKVPAVAVVPLVYNPGSESQVAEVGLIVCDELLGSGGDL